MTMANGKVKLKARVGPERQHPRTAFKVFLDPRQGKSLWTHVDEVHPTKAVLGLVKMCRRGQSIPVTRMRGPASVEVNRFPSISEAVRVILDLSVCHRT
jgi:hypothetical protein